MDDIYINAAGTLIIVFMNFTKLPLPVLPSRLNRPGPAIVA
jgi:hypothetical protein